MEITSRSAESAVRTAPELFGLANGIALRAGPQRCFYCGAPCGEHHPARQYVKDSFTGHGDVRAPGSQWVCDGCVACLQEQITITTHDGKVREKQRVRGYSWVLTRGRATACTKADREFLRMTCENPPEPPFVVCISDSGQKHLLYRAVVSHSRDVVTATLEGEPVLYRPGDLTLRRYLCVRMIAATGKPALQQGLSRRQRMTILEVCREETLEEWLRVETEPLTRLALWLAPGKDDCLAILNAAPAA